MEYERVKWNGIKQNEMVGIRIDNCRWNGK